MGCRQSKKDLKDEAKEGEAKDGGEGSGEGSAKLIVVFGATGAQGGSVIQAMKGDETYTLRAVTRNPDTDKAKAIKEQGVEVVQADADDVDSLKSALEGAYGVFVVTNYWEIQDGEKETQQGKNIVDAAKTAGVQHLIYSGLESVKEAIGKTCAHFDSKARVEDYIKEQEVPFTSVRLAFYFENLFSMMKPKKAEDGSFTLGIPMGDVAMDGVCVAHIGECIHQLFNSPEDYKGKAVGLSADKLKIEEYAAILSKQLDGNTFNAGEVTTEQFGELEFPGAKELANMFEFYQTQPDRDVELTRKLNPDMPTFEQWVEKNKEALEKALE